MRSKGVSGRFILGLLGLLMLVAARPVRAQAPLAFQHLTSQEGLAHDNVNAILQDRQGFIWFGTQDGLSRYDGARLKLYRHDPADSTSLLHDRIQTLYEDRAGHLWVSSADGLSRLDPRTGRFRRYPYGPAVGREEAFALDLSEDRDGLLWVNTPAYGLLRLDPATGRFEHILGARQDLDGRGAAEYGSLVSLYVDDAGILWIGASRGLLRFDPRTGHLRRYQHDPRDAATIRSDLVYHVLGDGAGKLWLATFKGLDLFDPATGQATHYDCVPDPSGAPVQKSVHSIFLGEDALWLGTSTGLDRLEPSATPGRAEGTCTSYRHDPEDPNSVGRGRVVTLLGDATGVLWLGLQGSGVNRVDLQAQRIARIARLPDGRPAGVVKVFLEDRAGRLWLGGEQGVARLDPATGSVVHFSGPADGLPGTNVNVIYEDAEGNVWVGTEQGGLGRLTPGSSRFEAYRAGPNSENREVYAIREDHTGALWIGTFGELRRRDPTTGRWTSYASDPDDATSLSHGLVTALHEDRTGTLWVGTGAGLDRFDRATGTFTHFRHDPTDSTTLVRGWVQALTEGRDGVLWVATEGLNRLDPRTGKVERFTAYNSNLPGRIFYGVLEDSAGRLWVHTDAGVVHFDPATRTGRLYDTGRAVMLIDQTFNAFYRSRDGRFFFGTERGYLVFHPDRLRDNPYPPTVVLTGLDVNEQPVRPGPGRPLRTAFPFADTVELAYDDRQITFYFAALHFSNPAGNSYTYRLEEYDDHWRAVSHEAQATYTSLPPGRYTLRVKAANSDGVWNETGASVRVIVAPPWWQTSWFRLLAVLALAGSLYGAYRVRVRALAERARQLEGQVTRRTAEIERQRTQLEEQAEKLVELDAAKSRFFSNISHEFRTPLTLIRGYLEDARDDRTVPAPPGNQARLSGALDQTHRLAQLVEELLDLTRLQAHRLRLHLEPGDLATFVRRVTGSFASLAVRREVELTVEDIPGPLWLRFDPERMEQVLANLIGNALKFTPAGGDIRVSVASERVEEAGATRREVVLLVADTGRGIPPETLPQLFERFYQVDGGLTRAQGGLGIGLALVKELVELHGGHVAVESRPGAGTVFSVHLPAEDLAVEDPEELPLERLPPEAGNGVPAVPVDGAPPEATLLPPTVEEAPSGTVLVVEDHPELRAFLCEHLEPAFRVVAVENGRAAWAYVQEHPPDLVLSDVMMPEMDGLELLARLKGDARYRTIPVLLLTARADPEDRLEGLEAEADGYVAKPFSVAELKAQVRNLIRLRQAITQKASRQVVAVQPEEMPLEDADTAFLRTLQKTLAAHLHEADFDVAALAAALFLSERTLQRRIADLTGFSAGAYLRHVRLLHAKELIDRQAYQTLSEVAHAVGFQNVSYFSKRYAETFGVAPGKLAREGA